MLTTRTTLPYFSPKRAIAPVALASSMLISATLTSMEERIMSLTRYSTRSSSSGVIALKWEKSNRQTASST